MTIPPPPFHLIPVRAVTTCHMKSFQSCTACGTWGSHHLLFTSQGETNLGTGQGMHIFPACMQVGFVWEHHTDLCVGDQGGMGEALLTCALQLSDCPTKKPTLAGTLNTHPRFVLCRVQLSWTANQQRDCSYIVLQWSLKRLKVINRAIV